MDDLESCTNVMIDQFGILKIIDFLWYKFKEPDDIRHSRDLAAFQKIVSKIVAKCPPDGKKRLGLIERLCRDAETFHELPKKLSAASEIALDYSMLGTRSLQLLAGFIFSLPDDFKLSLAWRNESSLVPDSILEKYPEVDTPTPQTQRVVPNPAGRMTRPSKIDIRLLSLDSEVRSKIKKAFFELEQVGLAEVSTRVRGSDVEHQWPPYNYGFQVTFTPKIVRWKELLA
ncbi:MAG: hypothetical protein HY075_05830, partial [Deltaproteobacteria bacterium]|nr:hypothetical protein [Deltaproteobacteria bacterium]